MKSDKNFEKQLAEILKKQKEEIEPSYVLLEKILENLPVKLNVTNHEISRYVISMNWKVALLFASIVILLTAGFSLEKINPEKETQTSRQANEQFKKTAQNINQKLDQVNTSIQNNLDQMDKDLNEIDSIQRDQDINNL